MQRLGEFGGEDSFCLRAFLRLNEKERMKENGCVIIMSFIDTPRYSKGRNWCQVRTLNDFMFDPHFRCTSTIMASCGLDPALAFFPFSRALDTSANIGISSAMSHE
jgi:hypothetical protein